jgi:uncharacterized DUF497 family protein
VAQRATIDLKMTLVKYLIWDEWNKGHITRHNISREEVEEVFQGSYESIKSYRNRIQVAGKTKHGRKLIIILSPEDRDLFSYGKGSYYPITAFEEEV